MAGSSSWRFREERSAGWRWSSRFCRTGIVTHRMSAASARVVALRRQHATIERDRDLVKGLEDVIGKEQPHGLEG